MSQLDEDAQCLKDLNAPVSVIAPLFPQQSDYYVITHLMRCQTQHNYRTTLLIEETKHVEKEPHETRQRVHFSKQNGPTIPVSVNLLAT